MVQLPQYVAIKSLSNNKYLRPNRGPNWWVRFEAADVNSRGVKHEVVYSKSHPGKVHIRCVETGRYWGFYQNAAGGYYIAALFKERNSMGDEDCTLFSYSHHMRGGGVTVVHLKVFNHAGWRNIRTNSEGFLKRKHGEEGTTNFIIKDWAKVSRPKTGGGGKSTGNTSTSGGASTRNTFSGGGPAIWRRNISDDEGDHNDDEDSHTDDDGEYTDNDDNHTDDDGEYTDNGDYTDDGSDHTDEDDDYTDDEGEYTDDDDNHTDDYRDHNNDDGDYTDDGGDGYGLNRRWQINWEHEYRSWCSVEPENRRWQINWENGYPSWGSVAPENQGRLINCEQDYQRWCINSEHLQWRWSSYWEQQYQWRCYIGEPEYQ